MSRALQAAAGMTMDISSDQVEKESIGERQPLPERYLAPVGRRDGRADRRREGDARRPRSSSSAITTSATK